MSADSFLLRVRFDRTLSEEDLFNDGSSPLDHAREVFAQQLGAVLTGESNVPLADAWGYGRAVVTAVEAVESVVGEVCTCDDLHGCVVCFAEAEELVGKRIRDSYDREWVVEEVGEKDGYPTISGGGWWARPEDVEVIA